MRYSTEKTINNDKDIRYTAWYELPLTCQQCQLRYQEASHLTHCSAFQVSSVVRIQRQSLRIDIEMSGIWKTQCFIHTFIANF